VCGVCGFWGESGGDVGVWSIVILRRAFLMLMWAKARRGGDEREVYRMDGVFSVVEEG